MTDHAGSMKANAMRKVATSQKKLDGGGKRKENVGEKND
jgi:hypothetical protein